MASHSDNHTVRDSGPETSWDLVARAADGDGAARSAFCRTYLSLVRSFFASRWRRSPLAGDVDDAVQEAFIECLRPGGTLARADAGRGDLRGFLFGVTRNVALRFEERARARTPGTASRLGDAVADDTRLSAVFDREWARSLMEQARELMQARAGDDAAQQRVDLLSLRFGSDLPIRDIAARWQVDAAVVHRAYARARDEFQCCLREVVRLQAVRSEPELDAECRRLLYLL